MKKLFTQIKWWEALLVYFILFFIFRYIAYFPILKMTDQKPLIFTDFVIYNYCFNSSLFLLKLLFFTMALVIGNTLWAVKSKYITILKSIIIGQFIYLFKYIILIIYALLFAVKFDFYAIMDLLKFKLSILIVGEKKGFFYGVFDSITAYDLLFIAITAIVYSKINEIKIKDSFKIVASVFIPIYIIYPLVLQFLKTF
jgi:hypothetical protein